MPSSIHVSVLEKEIIEFLQPRANQNFIDCTLGGGGHAEEILKLIGPKGKLLAIDLDSEAIARTKEKLSEFGKRLIIVEDNFKNLASIVHKNKFDKVHGILFDLGLSSDQLGSAERGFSFRVDASLDMRFGATELSAAEIVNQWPREELEKIFRRYGEEKFADRISQRIIQERKAKPITTTWQLIDIIAHAVPTRYRHGHIHFATRVFQALRIAVNHELENIEVALPAAVNLLEKGGRIAVISFHSLEDRIIKHYFKEESSDCYSGPDIEPRERNCRATLRIINKKVIVPSDEEIKKNPRSRSAKLRVAEKL